MYDTIIADVKERMAKGVDHLKDQLKGLRTGRATPALVENIKVEYYGSKMPLNQISSISTPDPRSIVVKPFDVSAIKEIEKAIQISDIGINPSNDGKIIRLQVPMFSQEQREKLVSRVKELTEQARVALRNIRREGIKNAEQAKKDSDLTEDDLKAIKDEIQDILKQNEDDLEKTVKAKSAEIMDN
ncbi:MAG: ribosome recycling factor [Planctomycetota bacterium]|jgi:ribosome recycling factor